MKETKEMTLVNQAVETMSAKDENAGAFTKAGINTGETKSGSQNYGKKALLALCFLVISTLSASAQKSVVLDAFSKYNIDACILNPDCFKQPDDYGFDLQQTTVAAGKEKTIIAKFQPSAPKEEQWTVVSVDGKSPSRGDINTFRKDQTKQPAPNQTDESSYRIEKEAADYLVVSYKQDPASIAKDAAFMKDCRSYITINLKTKRAEQVEIINEKTVKIKIISVDKLNIVTKYKWNEQANHYFTISQNLNMMGKFLGQPVPVQTSSEYSNYVKK